MSITTAFAYDFKLTQSLLQRYAHMKQCFKPPQTVFEVWAIPMKRMNLAFCFKKVFNQK